MLYRRICCYSGDDGERGRLYIRYLASDNFEVLVMQPRSLILHYNIMVYTFFPTEIMRSTIRQERPWSKWLLECVFRPAVGSIPTRILRASSLFCQTDSLSYNSLLWQWHPCQSHCIYGTTVVASPEQWDSSNELLDEVPMLVRV